MKFSVIHPTARVKPMGSFPSGWYGACESFFVACAHPEDVEYIVVVHHSRIAHFWATFAHCLRVAGRASMVEWGRFVVVVNYGRDCLVDQGNAGRLAATGEIIVGTMDDLFAPPGWDSQIAALIPDTSEKIALHCLTGSKRDHEIFIPPVFTKTLSDAMGPTSPEYEHLYTDDEQTYLYRKLGRVVESDITFEHRHPAFKTALPDEVYLHSNRDEAYRKGLEVFERRKALGFPRVELPGWPKAEKPEAQPKPGVISRALDWLENQIAAPVAPIAIEKPARRIAFCLPGETFRFEWLSGVVALCNTLGELGWQIKICLGYSTSCYTTRIKLAQEVIEAEPELVFWLDDDNIVKPEAFLKLVEFLDKNPDADVVTGWCWIRQENRWGTSIGNFWKEDGVHLCPMELSELFAGGASPKRIEHTGFPCVLMRLDAFNRLGPHAFRPVVKSDLPTLGVALEKVAKVPDIWFAGEDIAFCLRARHAGLQMWVDPACKVAHLKTISQEPDIQLFRDTPQELKDWRAQVNGNAVIAPENFEEVIK